MRFFKVFSLCKLVVMIVERKKNGSTVVLYVRSHNISLEMAKTTDSKEIIDILREDTDVFDVTTGGLLLRFRKKVIPTAQTESFYEAVKSLARLKTANRARFQGNQAEPRSKAEDKGKSNKYIMSNIFGFMDGWSASQKQYFQRQHTPIPRPEIRPSMFNLRFPNRYKQTWPFLRTIDAEYKKLVPDRYRAQRRKANQIRDFTVAGTAFTTVTLNLNHYSRLHTDSGDDEEGFGNLTVIERGEYRGGETCFPRYGLGVDVRTGDLLFMNVHEPHSNLPIEYKTPDAQRLSVVCYLRKQIWLQGRTMTHKQRQIHNKTVRRLLHDNKK